MKTENIEDIYELSPVQQGILFHSLYAPNWDCISSSLAILCVAISTLSLWRAWQQVAARHTILRTSFYGKKLTNHYKLHRQVKVLEQHDWRGVDPLEQDKRIKSFLVIALPALIFPSTPDALNTPPS